MSVNPITSSLVRASVRIPWSDRPLIRREKGLSRTKSGLSGLSTTWLNRPSVTSASRAVTTQRSRRNAWLLRVRNARHHGQQAQERQEDPDGAGSGGSARPAARMPDKSPSSSRLKRLRAVQQKGESRERPSSLQRRRPRYCGPAGSHTDYATLRNDTSQERSSGQRGWAGLP